MAKLSAEQNSGNRGKMSRKKIPVIFLLCILTLSTCGLEEYYYLPQVSEGRITQELNTSASINTSNIFNSVDHYYATGYVIFYKIYTSNSNYGDIINTINNNPKILSDYNALYPYTNPADPSSIPSLTTFSGKGFYELDLEGTDIRRTVLSKTGGTFKINFPTTSGRHPYIEFSGMEYKLLRSNSGFNPVPVDRYFLGSADLKDYTKAVSNINADVYAISGIADYAYALMYIVAVGQDPSKFSRLYGKPTFINVFKLPDLN